MSGLLVYGSYGYTGELVVDRACERGHDPVLAGRTAESVERQAIETDLDHRVFSLAEHDVVVERVRDVDVVLNCAGPFARTAEPLVDACVDAGTDYLDVTGEIPVFEALAARDDAARDAGVTVLPGVGFDVVPTDCLAAHLVDRLPEATALDLGFEALGSLSPGTAKTMVEGMGEGGAIRRDGRIDSVPMDHDVREVDFGNGLRTAVTIPWGDVSTAYHSTGVPNVRVYQSVSDRGLRVRGAQRYLQPLLGAGPVQSFLKRVVDRRVEGPDAEERASSRSYVWGEARTGDGDRAVSRLVTPGGYELTRRSAVLAAERVLDDEAAPGFQTPSSAFGADFVLDIDDVERTDEPVS